MFSHVVAQIMREWLGTRLWRLDVLPHGRTDNKRMAGYETLETRCLPHGCTDNKRMAGYETLETRCSPMWVHR